MQSADGGLYETDDGRGGRERLGEEFEERGLQDRGKDGTAKVAAGSKGIIPNRSTGPVSWVFPADKPMYSCIVVVDNPSRRWGIMETWFRVACSKEIADKILHDGIVDGG